MLMLGCGVERSARLDLSGRLAQAKRALGKNSESAAQFFAVKLEYRCDQLGLPVGRQTREPDQQDSRVQQALAEYEFSEILVCG